MNEKKTTINDDDVDVSVCCRQRNIIMFSDAERRIYIRNWSFECKNAHRAYARACMLIFYDVRAIKA